MAQAIAISLAKFTASVQAAVKAAVAKHPKFSVDVPNSISVAYLIRGFPIPESILATTTLSETQAFANEVASGLAQAHPELLAAKGVAAEGAVIATGRHVIIGIPPVTEVFHLER